MTARQLPLSRLGHLVPPLVEAQALVALVPATADLVWAAKVAWDIARIAARGGRRVALVDLSVEEPALHQSVGLTPSDGIVDAFEYGVSLSKAAHEVDGVFFIAAGSYTASTGDLYAHPRWRKLQAGFRSEGALLLLFVSAAGLAKLSAVADGAIVLAPEGFDDGSAVATDIAAAQERGTPLLGVARDRWMPVPVSVPPPVEPALLPRPSNRRAARAALVTLVLAGAAVGGWALFATARESLLGGAGGGSARGRASAASTRPSRPTPAPAPAPAPAPPAATPPARAARADTLAWTIRLAAYGTLDKALAHADRLTAQAGISALVTPVPQSAAGTVWYRVVAGSYATREAAAAGRRALWRRGAAPRGTGDLLRAPYSFALAANTSVETLRARGLPAVRGRFLGAFETPEQAAFTRAALTRAGVRATLLPRVGTTQ
ncbi:MAG TPA: SPOR domain-containing protein [Gemmatimonadales bacterium]|nr:SPOR domain-containing protein [Gemmatimonadales bacterium]